MEKSFNRTRGFFICVILLIAMMLLSSCSVMEFVNRMQADQTTLIGLSDPAEEVDADAEFEKIQSYYDEKTGEAISRTQYYAYHVTDAFKLYGLYVAIPCACIGFLIRRIVKGSASIRKVGLVLEIGVPLFYIICTYVLAAIADAVR